MRLARMTLLGGLAALAVTPATASAASVSYIDGGEVWQSTLDGSRKAKLSGGDTTYKEVAQADGGRTVGVRRDGSLSRFTLFNPDGAVAHDGPLQYEVGSWTTRAYPLSVDITPDGGSLIYGFSNSYYNAALFPSPFVFGRGSLLISSQNLNPFTQEIFSPLKQADREWPTFVGNRIVAASGNNVVLQRDAAGVPYASDFDPWFTPNLPGAGYSLERTDVAANGQVAAVEYDKDSGGTILDRRIDVFPIAGVGGAPNNAAGCRIPAQGWPSNVSISQDGSRIAWKDDGGVKVAGIPDFSGVDDCALTSPPVVISPTGSYPSIGGADVPTGPVGGGSAAGTAPPPSGSGAPAATSTPAFSVSLPAKTTAKALRGGVTFTVTVGAPGTVNATLSVPQSKLRAAKLVVIARGKTVAKRAGKVKVKLVATKAARPKLRRLKGVTATLKVIVGTRVVTKRVKLR
ncbi:MAG: hypothetical protein ACEQSX_02870 [Baekduiaceae bacterium]